MSELRLKDGSGDSYTAKVDSDNRLHTEAHTIGTSAFHADGGTGYNLNTGNVTLSSGGESAVLYFKYTGLTKFHVSAIAVGVGKLGGTVSDPALIKLYRNPTTGTIVDNAVAGSQNQNQNFQSAAVIGGDFYKGVEGDTFTNGDVMAQFYQNGNGRLFAGIDFVLPQGTSIGLTIAPNATTGGNIYAALIGYED